MTLCPGKRQRGAAMGDWERDLAADLARIAEWGAAAVATLMEQHELERYGVVGIGEAAEALGMEWHHLPIPDVGVPDGLFEARWFYAGHRLRAHLLAGRRVLLHCRGGLGRTGTIAARLMVELGTAPDEAVAAVRRARPGTLETAAQEAHARAAEPVGAAQAAAADRLLGCLLGGARSGTPSATRSSSTAWRRSGAASGRAASASRCSTPAGWRSATTRR
jgi:ADP-ribosyl-[dinitrogen reductase] hydrolase